METKEKQTGCDMCGNTKGIRRWTGGGDKNWKKIFLCADCWEVYKKRKEEMKGYLRLAKI